MKVNMTPNPLDVVTIHASQGDTEAREWEFELHNNGELIDTSNVTEQMFFKAYKGGTEQLLPENGSTPTTSPFLGDIKYPQGLLTDQEFLYRESPTEEDGLAKIADIKGNTLVWNQLIQNGNFADTSEWSAESGATLSISNNIATVSSTIANNGIRQYFLYPLTVGHKYLIKAEFNVPTEYRCVIGTAANQGVQTDKLISTVNTWTEVSGVGTCTVATTSFYCFVRGTTYENVKIRNVMCFDLTQMSLDISSPSEFTSLFPLSYYSYNQGSLLSFNGNGIKTVGKNLVFKILSSANIGSGGNIIADGQNMYDLAVAEVVAGKQYHIGNNRNDFAIIGWFTSEPQIGSVAYDGQRIIGSSLTPIAPITGYIVFRIDKPFAEPTFSLGTGNIDYEPYTSSTLSLPISTYFPTGMKRAGNVYDELLPTKAITRIGAVDLGTLNWTYNANYGMYTGGLIDVIKKPSTAQTKANVLCANRTTTTWSQVFNSGKESGLCGVADTGHFGYSTTETNPSTFKQSMSGVYLYYELATPTETSFTTASLVTENGEIPLSNEDGVLIGKCTEQLSENPGFIDAKIKLSDSDGECYSNKLQLHVERSPQ